MDDATRSRMALTAAAGAGAASQGAARAALATLNPTQLAGGGAGTQRGGGGGKLVSAEQEVQDAVTARLLQASPLFEAFWQGRLIPGACVQRCHGAGFRAGFGVGCALAPQASARWGRVPVC